MSCRGKWVDRALLRFLLSLLSRWASLSWTVTPPNFCMDIFIVDPSAMRARAGPLAGPALDRHLQVRVHAKGLLEDGKSGW